MGEEQQLAAADRTGCGPHQAHAGRARARRDNMTRGYTRYYVTFEFESGDRLELMVDGSEYGLLAEGDNGMLSFQGTRYLGFVRDRTQSLTNSTDNIL